MLIFLSFFFSLTTVAYAQFNGAEALCPPGSRPVAAGGGMMCMCPDGSYASLGVPCQQAVRPPPSLCPVGTSYCGNSNQCCNPGFYCSHYGCTPEGAVECGGHYCNPGQQCSRSGGCIPVGSVDCGPYYCQSGQKCAIGRRGCLPEDVVDCGPKVNGTCEHGKVCWTASYELPGVKKGETKCVAPEAVARLEGQISAAKEQKKREVEERKQAKRRAEEERRAALRRQLEEKREAARRKEQERIAEIARKKQERLDAARLAQEARNAEIARRKQEVEEKKRVARLAAEEALKAKLQKKVDDEFDRAMRAVLKNPRESADAKTLAAIALGLDPAQARGSGRANTPASNGVQVSRADRQLVKLAIEQVKSRNKQSPSADQLQQALRDSKSSSIQKQIASIGLGANTASTNQDSPAPSSSARSSTPTIVYTFKETAYKTIEVYSNGKRIATVAADDATRNYGYKPSTTPANTSHNVNGAKSSGGTSVPATAQAIATGNTNAAPIGGTSKSQTNVSQTQIDQKTFLGNFYQSAAPSPLTSSKSTAMGPATPNQSSDLWSKAAQLAQSNNKILDSRPGQTIVDTLAQAGGAYAGPVASSIANVGDLATAANYIKNHDYISLAQQGSEKVATGAAGAAGALLMPTNPTLGKAIGSASAQAVIDVGEKYLAPALGTAMYNANPELFTPGSGTPQIQIDPFTGRPIKPN